ncbi:TonB-dependent siderophore receptor [Asticcacaulis endophyticus]|uniref:TonB-dependent receptor n=1 Tax=Asticcacaulis endophyticus TaxID=1395890 RepID=A0A918Q3J1_9CAUL|nr:TonB-dependent receptor [Asticcacaulis endophyticus]GGZ31077.1 TonB-dependent receptor [Asticcacaulis endophyticus]
MTILKHYKSALLAGSALLLTAPAAFAQDAAPADKVEEVVIQGKRQPFRGDVPLRSVPQAVQVLDGEMLKDLGITRLDAALDMASGISRQSNFGGLWDSFAIRGFVGDPNMPSGYLVNGYNEGRGYGGPRDAGNVERIEIIKGPGSALFGRGEPGGTVNIITKKPKFSQEGSVNATIGEFDLYRVDADYTNRITSNIAGRITGSYEEAGSFRDTIESKKYSINPSFLARLTDTTTLTYDLSITHQEVPFDRGIVVVNGNLNTVPANRFLGEPGDGPIKINAVGHQFGIAQKISTNWNLLLGLGIRDTTFQGFSTEAELATGRQKLYLDGTNLSRQRRERDYQTSSVLPRAELSGRFKTGSFTHHILIGADYEDLEYDNIQKRYRPGTASLAQTEAAANSVNIFNPAYGKLPATTAVVTNTLEKVESKGIYLQDQIDLTDQWKFRIGGRYDKFEREFINRATNITIPDDISKFSPMVGLVYEPTKTVSVYASYGEGFRPQSGADASNNPFEPELSKSIELGMKAEAFDGALSGSMSIYKAEKSNILTADPINANFSIAVGKAESKGFEADGKLELPGDIKIMASYAYTDAYVSEGMKDPDFSLTVLAGDPLINVAKNSGNIMVFKDFHAGDTVYSVGARANYVGERLGETGTKFMLPDYTLVSLFAGYKPTEHIKVTAEINNLFDEDYFSASYSRLWIMPGAPRTAKISLGYSF